MKQRARTVFIPGLGEDESIFEKIRGAFPGEKLCLSLWKELPDHPVPGLNVVSFARELAGKYRLTEKDLLVGHSTGGWVALHIKQLAGARAIQLASWTDRRKIIVPTTNRHLIYLAAQTGLCLNRYALRYASRRTYRNLPSRDVFEQVFTRLITGNRANTLNQLKLIFNPVAERISVKPDLRIHARGDQVVRYPDEPACEVPGDHFSLYTHPGEVIALIQQFITKTHEQ
jgi:pimeloyl-ACP methyl ester carboxylesterase